MSPNDSLSQSFTLKDWISIFALGISIIALSLSIISFYYSTLRVDDNALARIADIATASNEEFIVAQVAFVNTGNRPAIVMRAEYQLNNSLDKEKLPIGGGDVRTNAGVFPLLLAPRDVRLVSLRIPIKQIIEIYASGAKVEHPPPELKEPLKGFFAGFMFVSLDSLGKVHAASTGMQIELHVIRSGLEMLGPVNINQKDDFPVISLLN